jgi:hypothetical protein
MKFGYRLPPFAGLFEKDVTLTIMNELKVPVAGDSNAALPLAGIKVLDLSRVLAGPWATMSLADLGAEVWKIENIQGGDDTRAWSRSQL